MAGDSLSAKDTLWSLFLTPMLGPASAGHSDKVEMKPVFWEPGVSTTAFPKTPWKPQHLERPYDLKKHSGIWKWLSDHIWLLSS